MQLVIDTAQTKITVKDQCFYIVSKSIKRQISPKRITSIAITSNALVSASAMILATENQVPIYYFDRIGNIKAKVWSPYFKGLASLRRKQSLLSEGEFATQFAIDNLLLKLIKQEKILSRFAHQYRKEQDILEFIEKSHFTGQSLEQLKQLNKPIAQVRNTILGLEGNLSAKYWKTINLFLPTSIQFQTRSRRPAKDSFNTTINYLYGMLYGHIEQSVFASGLDPHIGFMHTENYKKVSLVFDLIEPFRPYIDELAVFLFIKQDFEEGSFTKNKKDNGLWLGKKGKSTVIPMFNEYLQTKVLFQARNGKFKDHILRYSAILAKLVKDEEI